jgi:hypothetical protein
MAGRDGDGGAADAVTKAMCARGISRPYRRLKHRLTRAWGGSADRRDGEARGSPGKCQPYDETSDLFELAGAIHE